MIFTSLQWQGKTADAATKKATLKSKTMNVRVGNKKTIKITRKKKANTYSFTTSKKKVATVTKSGVVKGKKVGKATITVKETYKVNGKKKVRTVGKVKVTVKKAIVAATEAPEVADLFHSSNRSW